MADKERKIARLRQLIAQLEKEKLPPDVDESESSESDVNGGVLRCDAISGDARKAFLRAVELCSHHDFSKSGMQERLHREGFSPESIDSAVSKAVSINLIDDRRWGEMRAAALMRRGMGIPGIERELRGNGIDPESVAGWPDAFSERYGDELSRAIKIVKTRPSRSKNPQASAYARVIRKGYSPDIALKASRCVSQP